MAHTQSGPEDIKQQRSRFREVNEGHEAEHREQSAQELASVMVTWFRAHSYGHCFEVPVGARVDVLARAFQIMCSQLGRAVEGFQVEPALPLKIRFYRNHL